MIWPLPTLPLPGPHPHYPSGPVDQNQWQLHTPCLGICCSSEGKANPCLPLVADIQAARSFRLSPAPSSHHALFLPNFTSHTSSRSWEAHLSILPGMCSPLHFHPCRSHHTNLICLFPPSEQRFTTHLYILISFLVLSLTQKIRRIIFMECKNNWIAHSVSGAQNIPECPVHVWSISLMLETTDDIRALQRTWQSPTKRNKSASEIGWMRENNDPDLSWALKRVFSPVIFSTTFHGRLYLLHCYRCSKLMHPGSRRAGIHSQIFMMRKILFSSHIALMHKSFFFL